MSATPHKLTLASLQMRNTSPQTTIPLTLADLQRQDPIDHVNNNTHHKTHKSSKPRHRKGHAVNESRKAKHNSQPSSHAPSQKQKSISVSKGKSKKNNNLLMNSNKVSAKSTARPSIESVVDYMLTNYGDESACVLVPNYALEDLGDHTTVTEGNMDDFVIPPAGTGIYLIRCDISFTHMENIVRGLYSGHHLHAFLIIYDSDSGTFKVMSGANNCYTIREYHTGQIGDCTTMATDRFYITESMCQERAKKDMTAANVKADIASFHKYFKSKQFPRAGHNLSPSIDTLKSLSSNKTRFGTKFVDINRKTTDVYNCVLGFDDFREGKPIGHLDDTFFLHTLEIPRDHGFTVSYKMVKHK